MGYNMNNLFYKMTFECSNYNFSITDAYYYLEKIYNNLQYLENGYEIIDYQKLIYIDFYYGHDTDIQFYLIKIKEIIANFWLDKQKVINRIKN